MQPEDLERVDAPPEEPVGAAHEWLAPAVFAKPEEREPFWDYFDLLLLIGLVVASLVLANIAAFAWLHFHPELGRDPMAVAMPLQYIAYALIYLSFYCVLALSRTLLKRQRSIRRLTNWRTHRFPWFCWRSRQS
jgi:hypothetical protein